MIGATGVPVPAAPAQAPPDVLGGVLDAVGGILHAVLALPEQASDYAAAVDTLQYAQFVALWVIGIVTLGAMFLFTVRYRRGPDRVAGPIRTPEIRAPLWLEGGLAGGMLALFLAWWVWGFGQYVEAQAEAENAYEVYVTAKQWTFKFDYPDGRSTAGRVYLPAGRRVRFLLTSRDVIHSFFIPDFRTKQDALPGRYTTLGITPREPGEHQILCAELCGTGHARMWAEAVVLSPADFERWLQTGERPSGVPPLRDTDVLTPEDAEEASVQARRDGAGPRPTERSLAERGREVAVSKGCLNCHTVDGTPHLAPTWRGLWGSREALQSGDTVVVGAAYVTESMMDPQAKIVRGFGAMMPSFQGQVTPRETAALLEYLRSLAAPAREPDDGP